MGWTWVKLWVACKSHACFSRSIRTVDSLPPLNERASCPGSNTSRMRSSTWSACLAFLSVFSLPGTLASWARMGQFLSRFCPIRCAVSLRSLSQSRLLCCSVLRAERARVCHGGGAAAKSFGSQRARVERHSERPSCKDLRCGVHARLPHALAVSAAPAAPGRRSKGPSAAADTPMHGPAVFGAVRTVRWTTQPRQRRILGGSWNRSRQSDIKCTPNRSRPQPGYYDDWRRRWRRRRFTLLYFPSLQCMQKDTILLSLRSYDTSIALRAVGADGGAWPSPRPAGPCCGQARRPPRPPRLRRRRPGPLQAAWDRRRSSKLEIRRRLASTACLPTATRLLRMSATRASGCCRSSPKRAGAGGWLRLHDHEAREVTHVCCYRR
jgi:hypothetical protein